MEHISIAERHSTPYKRERGSTESRQYPGLVPEAHNQATDQLVTKLDGIIEKLPERSIVILMGTSKEKRTKSTLKIASEVIDKIYRDSTEVVTASISMDEINENIKEGGFKGWREYVQNFFDQLEKKYPNSKIIITCDPVTIKEFDLDYISLNKQADAYISGSDKIARLFERFAGDRKVVPYNFVHQPQIEEVLKKQTGGKNPTVNLAEPFLIKKSEGKIFPLKNQAVLPNKKAA